MAIDLSQGPYGEGYSDTTQALRSGPVLTKDVSILYQQGDVNLILYNLYSINNQVQNLLLTVPANPTTGATGERLHEPEFGSRLTERLYDPINSITATIMEADIAEAVDRWMSDRIQIDKIATKVMVAPDVPYTYYARVVYNVIGTSLRGILDLSLSRYTNPAGST